MSEVDAIALNLAVRLGLAQLRVNPPPKSELASMAKFMAPGIDRHMLESVTDVLERIIYSDRGLELACLLDRKS